MLMNVVIVALIFICAVIAFLTLFCFTLLAINAVVPSIEIDREQTMETIRTGVMMLFLFGMALCFACAIFYSCMIGK